MPTGCWRRNLKPAKRPARSTRHNSFSSPVCSRRRRRAVAVAFTAKSIKANREKTRLLLSPTLSSLGGRRGRRRPATSLRVWPRGFLRGNLSTDRRNHRVVADRRNDLAVAGLERAALFVEEQRKAEALGHFRHAQHRVRADGQFDVGDRRF